MYILNRDASANLTISSPLEAHKSNTFVYSCTVRGARRAHVPAVSLLCVGSARTRKATNVLTTIQPGGALSARTAAHAQGVDVGFENPTFACLEVDYSEIDRDPTGEALEASEKVRPDGTTRLEPPNGTVTGGSKTLMEPSCDGPAMVPSEPNSHSCSPTTSWTWASTTSCASGPSPWTRAPTC